MVRSGQLGTGWTVGNALKALTALPQEAAGNEVCYGDFLNQLLGEELVSKMTKTSPCVRTWPASASASASASSIR